MTLKPYDGSFDAIEQPSAPKLKEYSGDFTPARSSTPAPEEDVGFGGAFARGFKRSLPETKSLLYGAGAALAGAVGANSLRDRALRNYQRIEREEVQPLANQATFKRSLSGQDNVGEYVGDVLGNFAGQALQSAAVSTAGAAVGGAVGSAGAGVGAVPGAAVGAVGGLAARGVAKKLIRDEVKKLIRDQVANGVERKLAGQAGRALAQKRLAQLGGAAIAGAGLNIGQEAGISYTGRAEDAAANGEQLDRGDALRALGAGTAAGLVDTATEALGVGRILKGASGSSSRVRRVLAGAAKGALTEGATEATQAAIERFGAQQDLTSPAAVEDYIENAAAGAIGGGAMGAPSGIRRRLPSGTELPDPSNGPLSRAVNQAADLGALAEQQPVVVQQGEFIPAPQQRKPDDAGFRRTLEEQARARATHPPSEVATTPAAPVARPTMGPAPWEDPNTGEMFDPTDEQLKTVMHDHFNQLLAANLSPNTRFMVRQLKQMDSRLSDKRISDLLQEVKAERKQGLTAPPVPEVSDGQADVAAAAPGSVEGGGDLFASGAGQNDAGRAAEVSAAPETAAPEPIESRSAAATVEADAESRAGDRNAAPDPAALDRESAGAQAEGLSYDESEEQQDGDITPSSGGPFTIRDAAEREAARRPNARVFEVDGGFVVREPKAAQGNASATSGIQAAESPELRSTRLESGGPSSARAVRTDLPSADTPQVAPAATSRTNPLEPETPAVQGQNPQPASATPSSATADLPQSGEAAQEASPQARPAEPQPLSPQNTESADRSDARPQPGQQAVHASAPAQGEAGLRPSQSAPVAVSRPSGEDTAAGGALQAAAHEAATSPLNDRPEPTQAQKLAGNYAKGHHRIGGLDISIENPAGSKRSPKWPALKNHYGYIRGTVGRDKDHVDVFLTDRAEDTALPVFVVDQVNKDGSFDEHKVVLGAADEPEARKTYLQNYSKGWTGLGAITQMSQDEFKTWVRDSAKTKRPAAKGMRVSASPAQPAPNAERITVRRSEARGGDVEIDATRVAGHLVIKNGPGYSVAGAPHEDGTYTASTEIGDSPERAVEKFKLAQKVGAEVSDEAKAAASGSRVDRVLHALNDHPEKAMALLSADEVRAVAKAIGRKASPKDSDAALRQRLSEGPRLETIKALGPAIVKVLAEKPPATAAAVKQSLTTELTGKDSLQVRSDVEAPQPKTRIVAGRRVFVERARETLEAYFQPGREVNGYGGKDRVLAFEWNNGDWRVQVQGLTFNGKDVSSEAPRWHSTPPDRKELRAVLGDPAQYGKARAAAKAAPVEAAPPAPARIDDLGEKIGGARKDTSVKRGVSRPARTSQSAGEQGWRKKYKAIESIRDGRWQLVKTHNGAMGNRLAIRSSFDTEADAVAMIPLAEVARNHRVVMLGEGNFAIARDVSDRKRVVMKSGFPDREAASKYMAQNAVQLIETKTTLGEESLPLPEKVVRQGPERRKGPVAGEDFMHTFGFRGVEFGNWNNQAERQEVMNHAYDGLLDLADVLGVPPRAISLNGELALAFGARGQGLSGARAHYERSYAVMNLTKMKGAGALAHEWMHAVDHYMGRLDGKALSTKVTNADGHQVFKTKLPEDDFRSYGGSGKLSGMRAELSAAYDELMNGMLRRAEQFVQDTARAEQFLGHARGEVEGRLQRLRAHIAKDREYGSRRRAATTEELARFDAAADRILNGDDLVTDWQISSEKGLKARWTNESLDAINEVLKQVTNRSGFNAESTGELNRLAQEMRNYRLRIETWENANTGEMGTKQVPTEFLTEARKLDRTRGDNYWSVPHELLARAFSAYVEDKLAAKQASSDFLSYGSSPNFVLPVGEEFGRPFPRGEERKAFNAAFDKFFQTIETRETEQGVAFFSKASSDVVPVVKAKLSGDEPEILWRAADAFYRKHLQGTSVLGPDGEVRFSGNGRKKALSTGRRDPVRMSVARSLADLAKVARIYDEETDRAGDEKLEYAYAAAPVRLAGKTYAVKMVYRRNESQGQGQGFYTFEGFEIEEPGAVDRGRRSEDQLDVRGSPGSGVTLAELVATINERARTFSKASEASDAGQTSTARATDARGNRIAPARDAARRGVDEKPLRAESAQDRLNAPPAAGRSASGLTFDRAQQLKRELTARWGEGAPSVRLIESAEELQRAAGLPRSVLNDPSFYRTEGLYQGKPVVWINVGKIHSEQRFAAVLAHEALGHFGVEQVVGREDWAGITKTIAEHARRGTGAADLKRAIAHVQQTQSDIDPAQDADTFAKEVIAVMAEQGARNGIINRVISAVRRFLRRLMPSLQWSVADVRGLLGEAESFLRRGTAREDRQAAVRAYAFSSADHDITDAEEVPLDTAFVAGLSPAERRSPAMQSFAAALYSDLGTNSPFFREWFGQSQVQRDGQPLKVYHGTSEEFAAFDPQRLGKSTGHMTAPLGMFFDARKDKAEHYARVASGDVPADQYIYEVYLSLQNPYPMSKAEFMAVEGAEQARALRQKLEAQGYDGIRLPDIGQWIAFRSDQIKRTDNSGSFDRGDARMLFSKAPADALDDITSVMDASRNEKLLDRARAALREFVPKKVKDQLRPTWLGALTTRHLTELGQDHFENIRLYSDYLQQMGADRNQLQAEGESIAENARKWAGKHRAEARQLFDLMHEATIDGVDPAEEFKPLQFRYGGKLWDATQKNVKEALQAIREQIRGRSGDNKTDLYEEAKTLRGMPARDKRRRAKYPSLVERWNRLSPEAQEIYRQFREAYKSRSDEVEKALIARINDTAAPENHKRKVINVIRNQFETQRLQGVYFPLQRFGKYFVAAEKGDTSTFLMFERLSDLERAVKDLRNRGWTVKAQGLKSAGKAQDAPSGTFVAEVVQALKKAGVSDKTQDDIYQIYLQALPEMSMRKHAIHRKSVPGFDPDAVRAFAFNMHHGAHQLARLRYAHKLQDVISLLKTQQDKTRKEADADTRKIAAGDAILQELDRRHEWIMNPQDSQATSLVSSFGFIYYLGLTPAAALVNLTQNALVTYPYLAARFGGVKAMNYLLSGMRDSIRTAGHIQRTLTDPDELRAHQVLERMGTFDKTQAHNIAGIAEGGLTGYNPAWSKAMEIIGWGFHKTEVVNREASAMAAYRLARTDGQSFDEAVRFAADTVNDTHFDYTNQNRARFMQSGTAKVMLMFRQYSLNMTWHLGRMVWQATKGQSPEVKKIARRNLAGLLGMSFLFSGVLGLPLMSVGFGVLNAIAASFGDDDEPWDAETEFRAFLADMLGEDAASVLLGGVVNPVTGADVASRVSLSQLWFRDADRELDGRGAYYNLLEQAAGPMGGVLKNALVGKQLMDDGHLWRGVETVLPKGMKDVVKAGRYASEGVNNLRGDPIVKDLSLRQTLLQLAGFTPSEVADRYDRNRALKNYEQHILDRRQHLVDAYAMAQRLGDVDGRRDVIEAIRRFNKANPEVAISSKTIRRSLLTRARYSKRAESGIVLNPKLAAKVRAAVGEG
nr:PLxRFG domain-containing protein [uncultured Pseudomonas sp.]